MELAVGRVARRTQHVKQTASRHFDREAAAGYHADMKLADLPATPGSYVLLLTTGKPDTRRHKPVFFLGKAEIGLEGSKGNV